MSDIPTSEVERATVSVNAEYHAVLEDLARKQGQCPQHYIEVALEAGFHAMTNYFINEAEGIETQLISLDEMPEDGEEIFESQGFTLKPGENWPLPDETATEAEAGPWEAWESELEVDAEYLVEISPNHAELLDAFGEALDIDPVALVNWAVCYRYILDREKALGRHLLITSGGEDTYRVLTHEWEFVCDVDQQP